MGRSPKLRPPPKGRISPAGLWSLSVGERPYTVTIREDRAPGARLLLDYQEKGRRKQAAAGIDTVRAGKQFDPERISEAEAVAMDMSARLRLARLRDEVKPQTLTVAEAFALYTDPEKGGVGPSKSSRNQAQSASREWRKHLGESTPWNRVTPADVDSYARKLKRLGMIPTAEDRVKWLRTCRNWLVKKWRIRGLEDPTEGFDFQALTEGHEPKRPRYTAAEVEKLLAVRWTVDPRFALLAALMDDSGTRRAALIRTWRSALDCRRDVPPPKELAPHGWILYAALKGQDAVLHFLTEFERRELQMALTTHLSELERLWQTEGRDYPLFPGAKLYEAARQERRPVNPTRWGAYRQVSDKLTEKWLIKAQELAGVEHIEGRLWHGWRRLASDIVYRSAGLGVVTTAMGWKSERTPEQIYLEDEKHFARGAAREAMEKKRRKPE